MICKHGQYLKLSTPVRSEVARALAVSWHAFRSTVPPWTSLTAIWILLDVFNNHLCVIARSRQEQLSKVPAPCFYYPVDATDVPFPFLEPRRPAIDQAYEESQILSLLAYNAI